MEKNNKKKKKKLKAFPLKSRIKQNVHPHTFFQYHTGSLNYCNKTRKGNKICINWLGRNI